MKNIVQSYVKIPLILRIAIGLIIGIGLGIAAPQLTVISVVGEVFVGALKAIAPILVFVLVIASLANAGAGLGGRFKTVIFFYMISTFLAAVMAVIGSYMFPVTISLVDAVEKTAPAGLGEVFRTLLNNMVSNPISALMSANYVGILTWAVILSLAIRQVAGDTTKAVLTDISNAVSKTVSWVIQFAPFGIMGLVFSSISEYGLEIFTDYGKLLLLLVGCMLLVALVVDPLIVAIALRRNPYPLVFRCFKESGVTAFFTRSSAANIPVNMSLCEKLKLDPALMASPLLATVCDTCVVLIYFNIATLFMNIM